MNTYAGPVDLVLFNGRFATMDRSNPHATVVAIGNGRICFAGTAEPPALLEDPQLRRIDLRGRTVTPGLNDSHLHAIRGGLHYDLELRWDGVPSLAAALWMLREQAARTPPPQWVRVVGGWSEFQFKERRLPTLDEINEATGDTPAFILHLYDRAWLNAAAMRAVGFTRDTPAPPAAEIQRDARGNPTGLIIARPNAGILYATLAKGPKLPFEQQLQSTRHFMRELNRFGLTSIIDAGGGFQNYPEDYRAITELQQRGQLTVRIAYNLFTQRPAQEKADFAKWIRMTQPGEGDDYYRMNGAGEMLVFSAADFEDFLEPRPELPPAMENELREIVLLLARNRWPFRLHATYDESISRFLEVFEGVNREVPLAGLNWFFDHCETISDHNLERVKALGGGIAVQDRMAYQGEYFVARYGAKAAQRTPPVRQMLKMGIPVGAGTDATRVASYNPWIALYWLTTGNTVGGLNLYDQAHCLDRSEALRLYTVGSSWFSNEQATKGMIAAGQWADLTVLSADYFSVPDEEIRDITSVLTMVGGKVVYAAEEFASLGPPDLPVAPEWAPVANYGGYGAPKAKLLEPAVWRTLSRHDRGVMAPTHVERFQRFWGLGCECFAF